ncbi:MAG TPA: acetoacetate--CoA ligase [Steroidobacter sp.]|uniref:acetoacetate--CoA ligase n=1 Tax=Steroidobacter sp. TaxID=1978227 RepID=UPI002ED864E5
MEPAAKPIWTPSPERAANSALARFSHYVQERYKAPVHDYASLHRWSIEFPENFWTAVWDFCEIRCSRGPQQIIEAGTRLPGAKWFVGALLNYAENLVPASDDTVAIIFRNERGERRELTRSQLRSEVARVADGLKRAGVKPGDRVAGYLPNIPETVIAMLAAVSLGAIWSSCSPDFGASAVVDRFGQIKPRVLFAVDGYQYAGKTIDCLPTVAAVCKAISSIERVVLVPYQRSDVTADRVPHGVLFTQFGAADTPLSFAQLPFEQPAFILYSSGTTGAPKCIVHSAGGALIQQMKENVLHSDMGAEDRYFYFTTCGWVMWNALVSGLATGATIVLFDGAPLQPDPNILWRLAAEERVTIFGTGPRFLTTCEQLGIRPRETFDLGALRTVISTGAPLSPMSYQYVYREVHPDVQLSSISGGTDLMACFGAGCPTLPVYEGEIQALGLGMKVEVFDDAGKSLVGQQGELVCTRPFPSVPVGFWGDAEADRLMATYFSRYPNVWWHGDLATLTSRGTLIVHGRSDAVLNPSGVRIGTAELYRQLEKIHEVIESVAIAQEYQSDVRIVLFVRLRDGVTLDEPLREKICRTIRENTSPRHVPAKIIQAPDLPRTINGKLVELAIRDVVHGRTPKNLGALANPDSLTFFRNHPELRS